MKCHPLVFLAILFVVVILERADCSEHRCDASADNPENCKPTVRDHLLNTIRNLWQTELMPEQTTKLTGIVNEKDKELKGLIGGLVHKVEGLEQKVVGLEEKVAGLETENAQLKQQCSDVIPTPAPPSKKE